MLPNELNAINGKRYFETEEDIWDELLWFVNEKLPELDNLRKSQKKDLISIGQELWLNQFFDANYITRDWMYELINIVNISLDAEIPIASSVLDCPVNLAYYYSIIKQELIAIGKF